MVNIKQSNTIKTKTLYRLFDSGKNGVSSNELAKKFDVVLSSVAGRLSEMIYIGFAKLEYGKYYLVQENDNTRLLQENLIYTKIVKEDMSVKALINRTCLTKKAIAAYCDILIARDKIITLSNATFSLHPDIKRELIKKEPVSAKVSQDKPILKQSGISKFFFGPNNS